MLNKQNIARTPTCPPGTPPHPLERPPTICLQRNECILPFLLLYKWTHVTNLLATKALSSTYLLGARLPTQAPWAAMQHCHRVIRQRPVTSWCEAVCDQLGIAGERPQASGSISSSFKFLRWLVASRRPCQGLPGWRSEVISKDPLTLAPLALRAVPGTLASCVNGLLSLEYVNWQPSS